MPRAGPRVPMNSKMPSRKQGFAAWVAVFLLMLLVGVQPAQAGRGAYEAELPANLAEAKDLCALVPCADVFPGAVRFPNAWGNRLMWKPMAQRKAVRRRCWAT